MEVGGNRPTRIPICTGWKICIPMCSRVGTSQIAHLEFLSLYALDTNSCLSLHCSYSQNKI